MTAPGLEKPRVGIILFFHGEMNIFFPLMVSYVAEESKPMFLLSLFFMFWGGIVHATRWPGHVKKDE